MTVLTGVTVPWKMFYGPRYAARLQTAEQFAAKLCNPGRIITERTHTNDRIVWVTVHIQRGHKIEIDSQRFELSCLGLAHPPRQRFILRGRTRSQGHIATKTGGLLARKASNTSSLLVYSNQSMR